MSHGYGEARPIGRMVPAQLTLLEPARDDYPAPKGETPYSHLVVWRTCLAWEIHDWLRKRGGAA